VNGGGKVPIRVGVPEEDWPFLRARAIEAGFTSATAYVEDIVLRVAALRPRTQRIEQQKHLEELHSLGSTNKEIAAAMDLTIAAVRKGLATAGLHSNRERKSA
jgi:hypothetical protein